MSPVLEPYITPILQACLVFPLVAGVITLPFLIGNYRKYGGIAVMRVLVVYSFILYQLCAFLLTVLPLPSREAVAATPPRPIGWIPLTDLIVGLEKNGIQFSAADTLLHLENWKRYFTSADFFQIAANIIMQIPLGFYLRYYFRRSWKQCLLTGFCVSLFYELTQLTGLWFLYPHAYRYASVDDLINNTLGCLVGFWTAPLLTWMLPSREEIDRISYTKGQRITLIRRVAALALDWMVFGGLFLGGAYTVSLLGAGTATAISRGEPLWFAAYFIVVPWLTGGKTLGHAALKLRIAGTDGSPPTLRQLFIRYGLLYVVEPLLFFGAAAMVLALMLVFVAEGISPAARLTLAAGGVLAMGGCIWFPVRCWKRHKTFPHGYYSHTAVVQTNLKRK